MAALTSLISMPTCLVTPPCFKLALPGGDHRALKGGYGAFSGGPKVPNKWVSRVERKRSLGGHHRALGVGHDAGGEDKGDVYLKHKDKTFVVAIGSGIAIIPTLLEGLLKVVLIWMMCFFLFNNFSYGMLLYL